MKTNKCFCCGNETTNNKFCSRSCAAKINNKTPKRTKIQRFCSCGKPTKNSNTILCEQHYQKMMMNRTEYIMNLTLADYTKRDCIKNLHPSSRFAHIRGLNRSWNKDLTLLPCFICGYSKHVELAHIKPISSFSEQSLLKDINSKNNVVQLCPNCHWEFDNGLVSLAFPEQL